MTSKTVSAALLLSVLGFVAGAAASENSSGLAGNRGLSPIILLAAAPSPTVTDAGSAEAPVDTPTQQVKYDAVYSMCGPMHSADQVPYNIGRDNLVSPARAILSYFESHGILPNFATGLGEPETVLVKILKNPEHGKLVARNALGTTYTYHANPGYLGSDQMVFEVETMGKKFKVIDTVVIHNSGNLDYPTDAAKEIFRKECPSKNRSSLDIIELPTDGFASDKNQWGQTRLIFKS